ncbi:MAG: hypothetical protein FJ403_15095 [Verrucomicrobia bacterium]|nr:hypothetical protein [Verrucomicrobiota bacterium]
MFNELLLFEWFLYGVPMEFFIQTRTRRLLLSEGTQESVQSQCHGLGIAVLNQQIEGWSQEDGEPEILDNLKAWMSRNWFDVVGSKDPKHFRAGTRVVEALL